MHIKGISYKHLLIVKLAVFVFFVLFFCKPQNTVAQQQSIHISGKIIDNVTKEEIQDVSILIVSTLNDTTNIGTVTNRDGEFDFVFNYKVPFKVVFSHIAYISKTITIENDKSKGINVELIPRTLESEDIVVTAEMVEQEELKNTGTIDKISSVDIDQVASLNAFDLVSTLREVDVATQSMNLQSVSTRGFNSGANARFLQLTEGVDNEAPGLGFPVGDLLGPPDLDIASMNLTVGPAAVQYGSSALNGVLHTRTKDPFVNKGFSASSEFGLHSFKFGGAEPLSVKGDEIYDFSFRYAQSLWDKIAFKVTGKVMKGIDWRANNYDNIGDGKFFMRHDDVAGYDGVNTYGDENYVYMPVGINDEGTPDGSFAPVTRSGYQESSLVDYDISTRKVGVSLQYKFAENIQFTAEGRYGYTNTLYTSYSRIRLQNFGIYQFRGEFTANNFYLRGYSTHQKSGDTYDVGYLANTMLAEAKSNTDWFRDFEMAYRHGLSVYGVPSNNIREAREFADSGTTLLQGSSATARFEQGSNEFKEVADSLKNIYDFNKGAGVRDNTQLYHFDIGNEFTKIADDASLNTGGSFRFYDLSSDGTIFPDTTGNNITNYQYSGFAQFEKSVWAEELDLIAGIRINKNENFELRSSQQVGLNYSPNEKNFYRFSYQNAFRYPTVREQFLNTNLTDGRLLGGLEGITERYDLQKNSISEQAIDEFNRAVAENMSSPFLEYNRRQAELNNLSILRKGILPDEDLRGIKTEKTHSFEIGYRRMFSPELYMDLNYFVSFYRDFIGIKRLIKTRTSPSIDLYTAAGQVNNSLENDLYYVYANSEGLVTAQGMSFDIQYRSGSFFTGINGTWTRLITESNDPIIPGYNTPPLKVNAEWGNRNIVENVGFKMIFRGRTAYDWQSSFLDGAIEGYGHFDVQFTVRIPSIDATVKSGVTNLGVESYYDTFGGPAIGTILFSSITFSP